MEISRVGDIITLHPVRKSWGAFARKWAPLLDSTDETFFEYVEQGHDVLEPSRVVFDERES